MNQIFDFKYNESTNNKNIWKDRIKYIKKSYDYFYKMENDFKGI